MEKRVYIKTFGCQMNEHDSERMLAQLEERGYQETKRWEEADVILVNTCTVREKPEQKAYSIMGRFQLLKEHNPDVIVGLTGCVAEQGREQLLARPRAWEDTSTPRNPARCGKGEKRSVRGGL
jgi:tRNA-2-methylthio-N6-dimethylallyladenosine synthase